MLDELWMIRGSKPVLWTMPFRVNAIGGAEVEAHLDWPMLSTRQAAAVACLMLEYGRPYNGMWRLTLWQLRKIGSRARDGETAEDLFSWERARESQQPKYNPDRRAERDEFLTALYQNGVGSSLTEVEAWWQHFCNHALDWLLNKEKPVDMYFLKLHPTPLRRNWDYKAWSYFRRYKEIPKHPTPSDLLANKAAANAFRSARWLAVMPGRICERHVMIEHTRMWWALMKKVEETRLKVLKVNSYAQAVLDSLARGVGAAARVYSEWAIHSAHSQGYNLSSGVHGLPRIIQALQPGKCGAKGNRILWSAKIQRKREAIARHRARRVSRPNEKLPAMPAVQPEAENVRNGRPDVPGSRGPDGRYVNAGVLVRDDDQSDVATSPMLAVGEDERQPGLAGPSEL